MKKIFYLLLFMAFFSSQSAIAQEKTLIFATDPNWPPMEYINENNEIVGYSVDYMKAVGKEAGFKTRFISVSWEGIFPGMEADQFDAICSSVTVTPEREKIMLFSKPYFTVQQIIVTKTGSPINSLEALINKKVGSQTGTTGTAAIQNVKVAASKTFDDIGDAMKELNAGTLDAVICDSPVAAGYVSSGPYKGVFKIAAAIPGQGDKYALVLKKGNQATVALINSGIEKVQAKGIDRELQAKWIGMPAAQETPANTEQPAGVTKPAETAAPTAATKPAESAETAAGAAKPAESAETAAGAAKPVETPAPADTAKPAENAAPDSETGLEIDITVNEENPVANSANQEKAVEPSSETGQTPAGTDSTPPAAAN